MKNLTFVFIAICIFCTAGFGQAERKTTFRVLGGANYIAKTNLRNEIYLGSPSTEYHEKGQLGLSFEVLSSFYLSKKWRFNTGLFMDKKGYSVKGITAPADAPYPYSYKKSANYMGIPLEIEREIFKTKTFSLSVDAGFTGQWQISNNENGAYFTSNQLTLLGGLNFIVPYRHIAFIVHPIFRYSLTHLENSYIGSSNPHFNAYSIGLELGVSF